MGIRILPSMCWKEFLVLKNEREIRGLKRYMFGRSRMIQKEEDWVMLEHRLCIPKVSYLASMITCGYNAYFSETESGIPAMPAPHVSARCSRQRREAKPTGLRPARTTGIIRSGGHALQNTHCIPKVSYLAFVFKSLTPKSLKSCDIYIGWNFRMTARTTP